MKPVIFALIGLVLLGCTGDPAPSSPSPATPPAFDDESAIGNGGNELVMLIQRTFKSRVSEILESPEYRDRYTDAERSALQNFLHQRQVAVRLVEPVAAAKIATLDRFERPTKTRRGKLINEFNQECELRVVQQEIGGKRYWLLQFDEPFWMKATLNGTRMPESRLRDLLIALPQYAHKKGVLGRSGSGAEPFALSPLTSVDSDDREARSREAPSVAHTEYRGVLRCASVRIDYEALPPNDQRFVPRCQVTIRFDSQTVTVTAVHEKSGEPYLQYNALPYRQDRLGIDFSSENITRHLELWGWGNFDVLELTPEDQLFKVKETKAVENLTFRNKLFCDIARQGGLLSLAPWYPGRYIPLNSKAICDVTLSFLPKGKFVLKIAEETKETTETSGRFEQIGANVLLHHPDGKRGYLWLCPDCEKHLILGAGEDLNVGEVSHCDDPEKMCFAFGTYHHPKVNCGRVLPPFSSDPASCAVTYILAPDPVSRPPKGRDLQVSEGFICIGKERYSGAPRSREWVVPREVPDAPGQFATCPASTNGQTRWFIGRYVEVGMTIHVQMTHGREPFTLKDAGPWLSGPDYKVIADDISEEDRQTLKELGEDSSL